jgi:hypothetical protein
MCKLGGRTGLRRKASGGVSNTDPCETICRSALSDRADRIVGGERAADHGILALSSLRRNDFDDPRCNRGFRVSAHANLPEDRFLGILGAVAILGHFLDPMCRRAGFCRSTRADPQFSFRSV